MILGKASNVKIALMLSARLDGMINVAPGVCNRETFLR